jgi:hypothetical protein
MNTANWQMGKAMVHAKNMLAPTINWHYCFRSTLQNCHLFADPAQRLKPPVQPALFIDFPEGLPDGIHPPGPKTKILVRIQEGGERLEKGSGCLHYRFDAKTTYAVVPLESLGSGLFLAEIPNTAPGDEPEFYFSAQGEGGTTVCSPWNAPDAVYGFEVGFVIELFGDDFEEDLGWTVENIDLADGAWERGVPAGNGSMGDPPWDADGSGKCFLTGNEHSESDVDGGPTLLVSPLIDLSAGNAQVAYACWYFNDDNDDPFEVEVSNDGGTTWSLVERIRPRTSWDVHGFDVADFVLPTGQVKVRFSVKDNPDNSYTEAGLDAFQVRRLINDATLWADRYTIKTSTGSVIDFSLVAGPAHAMKPYLLLGSASGAYPGMPLPGGALLPLNWDILTRTILGSLNSPVFNEFAGLLDGLGTARATLDTQGRLDPSLIGMELHFAYLLGPYPFFASNGIALTMEP